MTRTRTSLVSAIALAIFGSVAPAQLLAGEGCGCEAQAVYCAPRCRHHCYRHYPPTGTLVQSAPVYAAPMMMAAPVYAAPMAYAPAAPAYAPAAPAYAPAYAPNYAPAAAPACSGNEQLAKAILQAMGNNGAQGAPNSPQAALDSALERRLDNLGEKVAELHETVTKMNEILKQHNDILTNRGNK